MLLAFEVMVDQRSIYSGLGRDAAHRRPRETLGRKRLTRSRNDLAAGVLVAGTPANLRLSRGRHCSSLTQASDEVCYGFQVWQVSCCTPVALGGVRSNRVAR